MSDVSFLIGNSLSSEVRRAHEERLVRGYHDVLVGAGVSSYSFDECWDEYAALVAVGAAHDDFRRDVRRPYRSR